MGDPEPPPVVTGLARPLGEWHTVPPKKTFPVGDPRNDVMWFENEQGQDFYQFQKSLKPKSAHALIDKQGVILQIQNEVSRLAPVTGELVEVEATQIPVKEETLVDSLKGMTLVLDRENMDEDGYCPAYIIETPVDPDNTLTTQVDIFQHMTNEEFVAYENEIAQLHPRQIAIINRLQFFIHSGNEYKLLKDMFTRLFGEERANELLARSW